MTITLNQNFVDICNQILAHDKTLDEWAQIESDDMFQSGAFEGGFDATEMEFTFSYYQGDQEYWFQMPLEMISEAAEGKIGMIKAKLV